METFCPYFSERIRTDLNVLMGIIIFLFNVDWSAHLTFFVSLIGIEIIKHNIDKSFISRDQCTSSATKDLVLKWN